MSYVIEVLQRFGLFAPKVDTTEIFGNRLTRIGTREARREVRTSAFVKTTA